MVVITKEMAVDQTLGNCIANSIKKREKDRKNQEKEKKKTKQRLIKEIKEFFKHLPVGERFEFYDNIVFGGSGNNMMTIEKDIHTGSIDINSHIPIEDWDLVWVRIMYKKLPEFESELRKRYGCDKEEEDSV